MKQHLLITYLVLYFVVMVVPAAVAQDDGKVSHLSIEEVCNVGDLLPEDVVVNGSSQGMAINGRYAFLMHDKGVCVVIDIKRYEFVSTFLMPGNSGHCNNASFGRERYDKDSQFPLLYVTECRGERACYVNDVSLQGSQKVQTIFYDGEDITGPADWFVDRRNRHLWLYCTVRGERTLKQFALPRLADSNEKGEVHLKREDVKREFAVGDIAIPQGSMKYRRWVYLPDGVPSRARKLHVADVKRGCRVATFDISHIPYEPEGVARKGRRLYMSFHTPRDPRQNRLYRFRVK